MPFYAVANGKTIGIFLNWNDCNNSVKGYKNAIFKKFDTREEADNFIQNYGQRAFAQPSLLTTNLVGDPSLRQAELAKAQLLQASLADLRSPDKFADNEVEALTPSVANLPKEFEPDYYVYTDGACSNNGKENALSGIGIFFGIDDHRNISKKIEDPNVNVRRTVAFGDDVENVVKTSGKQTNNTAELNAIIETYYIIENDIVNGKKIVIVSDSEYAIKCVSSYGEKCCKNVWNTDIPNKELVKTIYEMYKDKLNIQFMHIKAHTNNTDIHSFGNSNADKLATIACSW